MDTNIINVGSVTRYGEDCPQPMQLRLLIHPQTKKLVLLGGEYHNYFEHVVGKRYTSSTYYDILSQLSKKIAMNKDSSSPFAKVLLLIEHDSESKQLELFGGEFDPSLFETRYDSSYLDEARSMMKKIAKRYPGKVLYRGTDFRDFVLSQKFLQYYLYKENNERPSTKIMELLIRLISAYLLQDLDTEKYLGKEGKLAEYETNQFLEKLEATEKKLSNTLKFTKVEYVALQQYFLYYLQYQFYENGKFVEPEDKDFQKFYFPLFKTLNLLMELYTMNFILRMPSNSLSVFFSGANHFTKVFNLLCTVHGYRLLQTELTFNPPQQDCYVFFPVQTNETLALINLYNEKTKQVAERFQKSSKEDKLQFMVNIINYRLKNDLEFISIPPQISNGISLQLSYFGVFENFIGYEENQEKLFTEKIKWENFS